MKHGQPVSLPRTWEASRRAHLFALVVSRPRPQPERCQSRGLLPGRTSRDSPTGLGRNLPLRFERQRITWRSADAPFQEVTMQIHRIAPLRRIALALLQRISISDIRIRHHWTGARLTLHPYRHKGYWYHGRRREQDTMTCFGNLLSAGDTVLDVGSHIGYTALWFAHLVGPTGRVYCFEPGPNNLPYLRRNIDGLDNIDVLPMGMGDHVRRSTLFTENLTGQNNSFVVGGYDELQKNADRAYSDARVTPVEVEMTTLDTFCAGLSGLPTLIKIDVEGFELEVLRGAKGILHDHENAPILMVEVTREPEAVHNTLLRAGYQAWLPDGRAIRELPPDQYNVFYLKPTIHARHLESAGFATHSAE